MESDDALARLNKLLAGSQQGLTHEQSLEFSRTLSDIAVRLERATEVLARVIQLSKPEAPLKNVHLTSRELEILGHLGEGMSNSEIASKCWVSENTVKFHLKNIFRKLEVQDRGQATMIARGMNQTVK